MRSVGVLDTNLGLDHALALSKEDRVFYCLPTIGPFPNMIDQISGDGFGGNIVKVFDIGEMLRDDLDYVMIMDCYFGEFADELRKQGKKVFGPSAHWTKIENDRIYGWNELRRLGVGVPDGVIVRGMHELLEYIKNREDGKRVFFIKIGKYRGNIETCSARNWIEALAIMSQAGYGPYLTDLEILVQDPCPGFEVGCDVFVNGKEIIRPYLFTIEVKGQGTIGVWTEGNGVDKFILDKVLPSIQASNYRGIISFEFFWDGEKVRVHDPTARMPFPCSSIQAHLIKNYPEVVAKVAAGEHVKVEVDDKYATQIAVYTDDADTWRVIRFPEKYRERVGFRRVVKRNGDYYFVPGDAVVATAIGTGSTAQQSLDNAIEIGSVIDCFNTVIPSHFSNGILNIIDQLNALPGDFKF